jgi:hypothetical protein
MNSSFAQSLSSANRASSSSNKPDIQKRIGLISQFGRVNEGKVRTQEGRIEEGKKLARLVTREDEKWNELSDEDVQKGGEDEEKRNDEDEDEYEDEIMKKDVQVNKVIPSNQTHEQRQGQEQEEEEEQEQKQDKNINIKKSNSSDKMLKRPGTRFQLVSSVLQSAATRVVMAGDYDCDSSVDGAFENMTFNDTERRRGVGQVQGQGQGQGLGQGQGQGQSQSKARIGGRDERGVKGGKEGEQGRGERDGRGVKDGREGQGGKGDKKSSAVTRHSRPHDGKDDIGNDRGSYGGRERGSGRGSDRGSGIVEVSDSFSSASLSNIKNVKHRFPTKKVSVTYDSDTSSSSSSSTSYSHSSTSTSTSTSISITSTSFAVPNAKRKKERTSQAAIEHTTSFSTSANSSSTGNDYHLDQVTMNTMSNCKDLCFSLLLYCILLSSQYVI